MKKIITLIGFFIFLFQFQNSYCQDYLETATALGSGTTIDNSTFWTDVSTVTIDVTNISNVLLSASINMRADGADTGEREGNYNIYRSDLITDNSGIIKREILKNTDGTGVESWGIGTLVHIFDTSTLSGNVTYVLEHSNQGSAKTGRNIFSSSRLTAVALTTEVNGNELSNDIKRLDIEETSTSATYEAVAGLTSNLVTLPVTGVIGDIYVAASINSRANGGGAVAEYKLEYSKDGGSNWSDLGKSVKRSMINNFDNGIISLVGLLPNQGVSPNYLFRVAHRRVSGTTTIYTYNANLIVVALTHGNGFFPTFYSEIASPGVDITGVSTPSTLVTSSGFTSVADIGGVGPNLYVHTQYLVSATNLNESAPQRMRGRNQLFLDDGTTLQAADAYFRYIPDNSSFGSGGFIGLAEDLDSEITYIVSMNHDIADISDPDVTEDEVLTTSEVILTGFQTYDSSLVLANDNIKYEQEIKIFGFLGKIEIRSAEPIDAEIKIYNILGKLISSSQVHNQSDTSIDLGNFKGIAIVSIISEGRVITKKVII
ncbi:MAG: T9SS type A sorting domain-containing protein [Urechidicola sp.]|nr:T9SS type A sorting domain-containing protein [Urechidicola sp.]